MQSNELAEPGIVSVPEAFTVVLRNRPIYTAEHQLWLDEFLDFLLTENRKRLSSWATEPGSYRQMTYGILSA
jgi:hypothetical protein